MSRKRFRVLVFVLTAGVLCLPSMAQQKPGAPEDPLSAAGHKYFTDAELVNQDGARLRFYSDLLKGKVVVINAFFSECTDSCPLMAAKLEALQARLGDRLGKDVSLLSFSVDPKNDRPAKLKAYAERFHARPGWQFLTAGTKVDGTGATKVDTGDLDLALTKLGQKVDIRENHMTLFMIGNERTGLWMKLSPASSPDSMAEVINCVLKDTKDNKGNCAPTKN